MYSIKKDYKSVYSPYSIAIVPIKNFNISEKYITGNITIYPANTVDLKEINRNKIDMQFLEFEDDFFNSALIVFPIEHQRKDLLGKLMPEERNTLLSEIISKSENIISVFIYIYCNFDSVSNLPKNSGYIRDIYSGVLVYYPEECNSDFIVEKYRVNIIPITKEMIVDVSYNKKTIDKFMKIFQEECGEVGNILKQAFQLYANIIYSNNKTSKFLLGMSLIEYISNPYDYESMKKAKLFILTFSTDNKFTYDKLSNRFKELTGNKIDGIECGLRTNIIHIGKTIDELVEPNYKVDFVLREVQSYICNALNEIVLLYQFDWERVEKKVRDKRGIIDKNKEEPIEVRQMMDTLFLIDFRFLNNSLKEIYQLYPKYLPKRLSLKKLFYFIAKQVDIHREGYKIPIQIVYEKDEKFFNCDISKNISELDKHGFECEVGQFDIYPEPVVGKFDNHLEKLLKAYLFEMNYSINPISQFSKIVLISDRNEIDKEFFEDTEKLSKILYLGKLSSLRTSITSKNEWFDIQHLFTEILNIKPWDECEENFIYQVEDCN